MRINPQLMEKIKESLSSVLPITAIVLLLSVTIAPLTPGAIVLFLFGALLLIGGIGVFTLGVDMSMTPMGQGIGVSLSRSKHMALPVLLCFVLGALITVAEPDLQVLAEQIPAVPNMTLILTVAVGVGIFLVVALLRVKWRIPLSYLLVGFYILVFALSLFVPEDFIPAAFDSGGVTTGPITVPFIMALGVGMASVRSDKNATSDSFGLVALCSIGPILSVMILGICYTPDSAEYSSVSLADIATTRDAAQEFIQAIPHYVEEVAVAMVPICLMFLLFQLATRRFKRMQLLRIVSGLIYTYLGLVLFLTGVNVGFMPAGQLIGATVASGDQPWLLIPIGMVMGYFIVAAEPAVHVLIKQVEEVSMGSISQSAMRKGLSIGVAVSVGVAMLRVLTGVSIMWFLVPGYAFALALTFFVPQIFTGVAFASGGVGDRPHAPPRRRARGHGARPGGPSSSWAWPAGCGRSWPTTPCGRSWPGPRTASCTTTCEREADMRDLSRLVMIVTIIERGCGNKLTKLYDREQVFTHVRCEGTGTATSEIMDILGLGSSEKDIILSLAPAGAARALLDKLEDDLHDNSPGRGIAFAIPLEAVSNLLAAAVNARTKLDKNKEYEEMQEKSSLIMITVNQGFTDDVMATARKAGARGGTVVRGRWVAKEEVERLEGVTRQDEKEILLIVVPREVRNSVMEAVNANHGLQSEAGAVICSLGVEQIVHLG